MSIDFSNRDPKNKDAVYSIRPAQQNAWIETAADGSWTGKFSSTRPTNPKGWQEVGYATVTLQDGRQFRAVLDGSGQPISEIGDTIGTDDNQARSWAQNGPKPLPPGAAGTKNVNGRVLGYNPETGVYDIDQGEVPVARTPEQQQTQAAQAQTAQATAQSTQAENNEKQWNSQHGYGWVTHADRDKAIREQQAAARTEGNQQRIAASQEAANQLAKDRLQFDKDKANLPDVKATPVDRGGQRYWQVLTTTPQGATKITNYGPDGKEISAIPSEGETSTGGPRMVDYITDASVSGLTAIHTAIYSDTSLTPTQKEKRFQEVVQIANQIQQSAATQENRYESDSNREYNTAHSRLTYLQTGMGQALDFVSKLNADLPGGTGLGGKAFAAIIGIQMLQMQMSGINDIKSRPTVPTITRRDLSSNAALTAHNQTIAAQAAAAAQPAADPAMAEAVRQQQQAVRVGGTPTPGEPGGPPLVPASAASAAPSSNALPANRPDQTQSATQIENAINPPQESSIPAANPDPSDGQPVGGRVLPQTSQEQTAATPVDAGVQQGPPVDMVTLHDRMTGQEVTIPRDQYNASPEYQGARWWNQGSTPGAQPDGVQPETRDPSVNPSTVDPQSQTQPSDWPALASYGQLTPTTTTASSDQGQGGQAYMAARRAQIAATPPWQLSSDEIQEALSMGMSDEEILQARVPGRAA